MDGLVKAVEKQNKIIQIQSEVINELFMLLLQHIAAAEAGKLPLMNQIRHAVELQKEIEGMES